MRRTIFILLAFLSVFCISATNTCYYETEGEICDNNNVIDGYWWRGAWVPGMPTYESQFLMLPDVFSGIAVFYGPYIMEGTAKYRGLNFDRYLGGIALPTCSSIGGKAWIKYKGEWEGPYLVVDCARRNDLYGVAVIRGEAVEVDFNTALRWGMVEQRLDYSWYVVDDRWSENVTVSLINPMCIEEDAVNLREWIEPKIEYEQHYLTIVNITYHPPFTWRIGGEEFTYYRYNQCNIEFGARQ